jgi:hypothetical protein
MKISREGGPTMSDGVDRSWPGPRTHVADDLEHALSAALNRFSAENASNTPDWILAQYLLGCLDAWNTATQQRETWYGRDARPTGGNGPVPVAPDSQTVDAGTGGSSINTDSAFAQEDIPS